MNQNDEKLYDIQKDFIEKASNIIKHGRIGVFSSPTGTGKTLSLLHSLKSLFSKNPADEILETALLEELFGSKQKLKIFYVSRTHSQLSQVIQELKNVIECRAIVLGSRKLYCVNDKFNTLDPEEINSKCKSAVKNKECIFHLNLERAIMGDIREPSEIQFFAKSVNQATSTVYRAFGPFSASRADKIPKNNPSKYCIESSTHQKPEKKIMPLYPTKIHDIEDFIKECKSCEICPYYLAKKYAEKCDILFMPYSLLFTKEGRQSLDITLEDSIIVVDEAHNLIETIVQINTAQVNKKNLVNYKTMTEQYLDKHLGNLSADSKTHVTKLIDILEALIEYLDRQASSLAKEVGKKHKISSSGNPEVPSINLHATVPDNPLELSSQKIKSSSYNRPQNHNKSVASIIHRKYSQSLLVVEPLRPASEEIGVGPTEDGLYPLPGNRITNSHQNAAPGMLSKCKQNKSVGHDKNEKIHKKSHPYSYTGASSSDRRSIYLVSQNSAIPGPHRNSQSKIPLSPRNVSNNDDISLSNRGSGFLKKDGSVQHLCPLTSKPIDESHYPLKFQSAATFMTNQSSASVSENIIDSPDTCLSIPSSEFLVETGLYNYKITEIVDYCKRSGLVHKLQCGENSNDFHHLLKFLALVNESDAGGMIFYTKNMLKFTPLDVQMYFEDILKCKSLILAGGTMEPIDDLIRVLYREPSVSYTESSSDESTSTDYRADIESEPIRLNEGIERKSSESHISSGTINIHSISVEKNFKHSSSECFGSLDYTQWGSNYGADSMNFDSDGLSDLSDDRSGEANMYNSPTSVNLETLDRNPRNTPMNGPNAYRNSGNQPSTSDIVGVPGISLHSSRRFHNNTDTSAASGEPIIKHHHTEYKLNPPNSSPVVDRPKIHDNNLLSTSCVPLIPQTVLSSTISNENQSKPSSSTNTLSMNMKSANHAKIPKNLSQSRKFHSGAIEYHSYPHVCKNFTCQIPIHGCSSKPLILTQRSRSDENVLKEYINTFYGYTKLLKSGGIVCFVPSFHYINLLRSRMHPALKDFVVYDPETTFDQYRVRVLKGELVILFSVMGGRLSEGINFNDDLCRLLVIFGVPYPTLNSELRERERFYKKSFDSIDYQTSIAMKQVNQAVGRAIRHKDDHAAIILMDQRYTKLQKYLSPWIRESSIVGTFSESLSNCVKFYGSILGHDSSKI